MNRLPGTQFQGSVLAHQPTGHRHAVADAEGDHRLVRIAQAQRVVARRQFSDLQHVAGGPHRRGSIGGEGAAAQFKQRPGVWPSLRGPRDAHCLADPGVEFSWARLGGGFQGPRAPEVRGRGRLQSGDVRQRPEIDAALGVGPQGNFDGVVEATAMEGHREGMVWHGLTIFAEDFHPIAFAASPKKGILDVGGPFDAVDFPAPGGTQFAFLAAGQGIDTSLHGGRDPAETLRHPEDVGQHPGCGERGERHFRAGAHAIEGGGGQRESGVGEQFWSGRLISDT